MRKKPSLLEILIGLVFLGIVIYYAAGFDDLLKTSSMPDDEKNFVGIMQRSQRSFASSNEVAQNYIRNARKTELCDAPIYLQIRNWTGRIYKIKSTSDGDAVVDVEIAKDIYLVGLNGTSAAASSTVIKKNTPLFQQIIGLSEGQSVEFSGSFFTGEQDCFKEISFTQKGSIQEPEFLFRFFSFITR